MHPAGLSPAHIGGHIRFVVGVVAEALSRSCPAGDARTVSCAIKIINSMRDFRELYACLKVPPDSADASWYRQRGYQFEKVLHDLLDLEDLAPRTSYKIEGEQIDGSFVYNGKVFLLEAKWHKSELPASVIYAFKGKVDGKLIGTIGVFISISGYSPDGIDALSLGKTLNVILFDAEDIDAAMNPEVGFRKVLEFKLRVAAEEGAVYVPYKVASVAEVPTSLAIVCEGMIDREILRAVIDRIVRLDNIQLQVDYYVAGGSYNLSKVANSINSLAPQGTKVLIVADADMGTERIHRLVAEQLDFTDWGLVLPDPFIESWLFDDIEEFHHARRLGGIRGLLSNMIHQKAMEMDIDKLAEKDPAFCTLLNEIRSLSGS